MQKAKDGNIIVTAVLTVILVILLGGIAKSIFDYYTGPSYVVSSYIKYLNNRDYKRIYYLLSPDSTQLLGGKEDIVGYYKRVYEKENKLFDIKEIGYEGNRYIVQYRYAKETEKGVLSVKKIKGKWYVIFPFQKNEVEVFAPYGATVYLDSKRLTYTQNQCYEIDNVLPGNYMLKVDANKEGYKDYYHVVHIPEDCKFIVPYEVAHVTVLTPAGFQVKLDRFAKASEKAKIEFEDILLGNYKLEVQDIEGDFIKQQMDIKVSKGDNKVSLGELQLSEQGKTKLDNFLNNFYQHYLSAIREHSVSDISAFFAGNEANSQRQLFDRWYIAQKDVIEAEMQVKLEDIFVDRKGFIHAVVTENVELENHEYNEENEEVHREYKVMITWDTSISPLNGLWKIVDRDIKESMVAVKDQEGRWVQY